MDPRDSEFRVYCQSYASSHFTRLCIVFFVPTRGKYPPAKPGALGCEPLKAAARSLTRPRKTTGDNEVLTCRGPLLNLPAHFPCYKLWEFVTFLEAQRPHAASPGAILCEKAHHCEFPANTAVTVKLLLPPRQSRGVSQRTSPACFGHSLQTHPKTRRGLP